MHSSWLRAGRDHYISERSILIKFVKLIGSWLSLYALDWLVD